MDSLALQLVGPFVGAALVTFAVTPSVGRLAVWLGVVDLPGGRRAHEGAVPRLGGVAVFLGLLVCSLGYALLRGDGAAELLRRGDLIAFLLPLAVVFGIGLVDDVRGLGPAPRVVAVAMAATVLIQGGYVLDRIATPWGVPLELGFLAFPVTLLWFVGITNAFNLVDGVDGLLSAVGIAALLGCAGVGAVMGMVGTPALALTLAGALAGFLYWNWHKARIFMGDSGSLLVGFSVAALSLKVSRNAAGAISFHIPLALCALPMAETFLTLARRHISGAPYFQGDRSHIHHVMLNRGLSVPRTVRILGGISGALAAAAVLSRSWREGGFVPLIGAIVVIALLGLRWLGYVELKILADRVRHSLFRRRLRGSPAALALAGASDGVADCVSGAQLRTLLHVIVQQADLDFLALEFPDPSWGALRAGDARSARRFLAGVDGERAWCFAVERADADDPLRETVSLTVPVALGEGRFARLTCHRSVRARHGELTGADVSRYLAEPMGALLQRLGPVATRVDAASG